MHYYDPRAQQGFFSFVETVRGNKALFTKRQVNSAEQARRLYKCQSHPSIHDFKWVLRTNGIKDCPVSLRNAKIAQKIWGPNIATLKGKTTRIAAEAVKIESLIPIPKEMIAMHKDVALDIDIFFVNKNYKHYKLPFGSYCQVHKVTNPRNSLAARTQGAISLGSSGNMQGAQRFLSIKTGEVIIRYSWTEVPMPDEVIDRVNHLGKDQPEQLIFTDRHGIAIGDHDPEITGVAERPAANVNGANDDKIPGVPADDIELQGVDMGNDDEDQALPDIFERDNDDHADRTPNDVPEQEVEINELAIVQPEQQLIVQQSQDAAVPVAEELVRQYPNRPRRSTRVHRQVQ